MFQRALSVLVVLVGCAPQQEPGKPEGAAVAQQAGTVRFDSLSAQRVEGVFELRGHTMEFLAEPTQITFKLRGIVLTMTVDPETQAFDLDGFDLATGKDTAITGADRAILHALEEAIAGVYTAHAAEWPALKLLNRGLGLWGDWPTTMPLKFLAHVSERSYYSYCQWTNRPGQGPWVWYIGASHDCWDYDWWEDRSTNDMVVMSMFPSGPNNDGTYFGNGWSSIRNYEPDHPSDQEIGSGNCFGRCGSACGSDTQFTEDCTNHDQCVRFGHDSGSLWCDDQFSETVDDWAAAPSCGGVNLYIPYNWVGTSYHQNCPTSWNNSNDGCDFGCQFLDFDCFR